MSENRCRRCNRKLIDPDAVYGWRCAKKLGVSTHMPSLDWLKQQAIYDTNLVMDIIIVSGYELNYLEAMDLYESVYKWALAKETDDQLLMDMAYDDSISVEQFMKMYDLKYTFATDDADIFIFNPSSTRYNYEYFRPNGIDREDIDELAMRAQNFLRFLVSKSFFVVTKIFAAGYSCKNSPAHCSVR